jgi:phenylacetate-coenzyme A ligase PaaK-like adenylate-forming protein
MSSSEPFGLESIASVSLDDGTALQTQRLNARYRMSTRMSRHTARSLSGRCHSSRFTRLEDLEKFPFASKQDGHTNDPFGLIAAGSDWVVPLALPRVSPRLPAPCRDIDMALS